MDKENKIKKEDIKEILDDISDHRQRSKKILTCSSVLPDKTIIEMVYDKNIQETKFAVFYDGQIEYKEKIQVNEDKCLIPYPPKNNILFNQVILFPSKIEEYADEKTLVLEVRRFIHKYLDITSFFEKLAGYYILLTWVYDKFNELPYLRTDGQFGSGKTRFLQTIGAICYKPIFTSGATTVSPVFRILDRFRGTLVLDEINFERTGMYSAFITILNQGHTKGFPVLRSVGENFEPTAFHVFGPKIVATRGPFKQKALESRFLVEKMGLQPHRKDIPISLPASFWEEAEVLRNKLLLFRFRNYDKILPTEKLPDEDIKSRLKQIANPLLNIIPDLNFEREFLTFLRACNDQLITDQGLSIEGDILEIIVESMFEIVKEKNGENNLKINEPKIGEIAESFNAKLLTFSWEGRPFFYQDEFGKRLSEKSIGYNIRTKLLLATKRTNRGFVIPALEQNKVLFLMERYGTNPNLLRKIKAIKARVQEKTTPLNLRNTS